MSGSWQGSGQPVYSWESISGQAVKVGDTYWPGYFTLTVPSFTFVTDEFGEGSWHLNLRDSNFPGTGAFELSVWINMGATILISDTFAVVVD
jgi:hypothetical protein